MSTPSTTYTDSLAPRTSTVALSEITNPLDHTPPTMPTIEADRAVVEQAKGALMLRYGLNSHEALALLPAWSREMGTSVHAIAHAP